MSQFAFASPSVVCGLGEVNKPTTPTIAIKSTSFFTSAFHLDFRTCFHFHHHQRYTEISQPLDRIIWQPIQAKKGKNAGNNNNKKKVASSPASSSSSSSSSSSTSASDSSPQPKGFGKPVETSPNSSSTALGKQAPSPKPSTTTLIPQTADDDEIITTTDDDSTTPSSKKKEDDEVYMNEKHNLITKQPHMINPLVEEAPKDTIKWYNIPTRQVDPELAQKLRINLNTTVSEVLDKVRMVKAQSDAAQNPKEDFTRFLVVNRDFWNQRFLYYLTSKIAEARSVDIEDPKTEKELMDIRREIQLFCREWDVSFYNSMDKGEDVIKKVALADKQDDEFGRHLDCSPEVASCIWLVLYASLLSWRSISESNPRGVDQNILEKLKNITTIMDKSQYFQRKLEPEFKLLQRILVGSQEEKNAAFEEIDEPTTIKYRILLSQLQLLGYRAYGPMSKSLLQLTDVILKNKHGVEDSECMLKPVPINVKFDKSQSVLLSYIKNIKARQRMQEQSRRDGSPSVKFFGSV